MRARMLVVALAGGAIVCVVFGAWSLAGSSAGEAVGAPRSSPSEPAATPSFVGDDGVPRTDGPVATTKPETSSISHGQSVSEEQVLALVAADSAEFRRIDRSFVKTTTIGAIRNLLDGLPEGYSDEQEVIVATGVGVFLPSFSVTGQTFGWGSIVVCADDGMIVTGFSRYGDVPVSLQP